MLSEVEASPRHGRLYVILSETKDLLADYTLSTVIARLILYIVIARLGTSRGNLSRSALCHSERSEESPQSRPETTRVDSA